MSNSVLFLFSSNAEALYAQDAVNVIGLPRGALAHFRYDKRWVDPRVWDEIETAQNNKRWWSKAPLVGNRVLCVFVDRSIHSGLPHFAPTRFGRIITCETRGTILHCYFKLEGFYDWDHAARKACGLAEKTEVLAEHRQKAIREHRSNLRLWLGEYQNEKNETKLRLPLSLFAVRATEDDLKKSNGEVLRESTLGQDRHAWESVVKTLHALPYFGDTVFYRLTSMQMIGRPERGVLAPIPWFSKNWAKAKKRTDYLVKPILPFVYGYRFKWIAPYELVLDFYQGRSSLSARMKAVTIKLTFEDTQFFRSVESVPILGRFDSARIVIFPIFGALDGPSHMVIQAADVPADVLAKIPACTEVAALSSAATDTPKTDICGFSWYDAQELSAYQAIWDAGKTERDIKQKVGVKVDTNLHMPIAAPAPVAPQLSLPIESVHSKHYLMVGGFWAFVGFSLHFLANERTLTGLASIVPASVRAWPVSQFWVAEAGLRLLGAWLIFRAFVFATRKLPSSGVK